MSKTYCTVLFLIFVIQRGDSQFFKKNKNNEIIVEIPWMESLEINGDYGDWENTGAGFHIYSNRFGKSANRKDLSVHFKLGWNERGIGVYIKVTDDNLYADEKSIWKSDAIELFISDSFGSHNMLQYTISPDPLNSEGNMQLSIGDYRNRRSLRAQPPEKEARLTIGQTGYRVEALLSFKDLGWDAEQGDFLGLQIGVTDIDKTDDPELITYHWHFGGQTYLSPLSMHKIQLVEKVEKLYPNVSARCWLMDRDTLHVVVTGDSSIVGKTLRWDDHTSSFSRREDYARAELIMPYTKQTGDIKEIYIDGVLISVINTLIAPLEFSSHNASMKFENEIRYFEAMDAIWPPTDSATLFLGSSSFRRWHTLQEDMPGITIINRGFGGSTMGYAGFYFPRLVARYDPSKIVVYEGDNDIPQGITPDDFQKLCKEFIERVHRKLPGTTIYFLSIKPSLAHWNFQEKYVEANACLKNLADEYDYVEYIDISSAMLNEAGQVRKEFFTDDGLHMNDEGYAIWRDIIYQVIRP